MRYQREKSEEEVWAKRIMYGTYTGCFFVFMLSCAFCVWVVWKLAQWVTS